MEQERQLIALVLHGNDRIPALKPHSEIKLCGEELDCGHSCGGCKGESEHLPCLEKSCRSVDQTTMHDNCAVCSHELSTEPCLTLDCGHVFHAGCIREMLRHRWSTQRITFNFMKCPSCQAPIEEVDNVPQIRMEIFSMKILQSNLQKKALREL